MRISTVLATALVCGACSVTPTTEGEFASTTINPDGTVTFKYMNDSASEVMVDVQFAGRHAMTRNSVTGVWNVTLGPAAPDMYPYCFVVDGVSIMDPANGQWFPNEGFKNSLLDIPGSGAPLIHSPQNVPHGSVDYISYYSQAIGAYNHALVYTPPSYNKNKEYPVFYLISGTTDTEEVYYKVGRVNHILDNLIAQGEAREMIVVLPYGNPAKLINAPMQVVPGGFQDYFSKDLINDLMPYVESHYSTINDSDHRAIGGFSRGGNQGLMNGLTNLDKFSYLCSYSSFTSTELPGVYDNAKDTNSKIHLLWTGVGTDDFLYGTARDYTEFLDKKGIRCVKEYTDDKFGHTWMNAKHFLDLSLRLLFNPEASAAAMAQAQPTKARTGEEKQFTPGVMARLFPKPLISPEVAAGGDVTFRIKAPKAHAVLLEGEMLDTPQAMLCDSDGVWSVTVAGIDPDVYCYNFVVDGTQVADAQNMYLAPDRGFKRSILDLAAQPDVQCDFTPVQYKIENCEDGTQHTHATVGTQGPVVALIAGPDDTFESWHKIAKANVVLDHMVATGQCKPCVLHMTDRKVEGASVTLNKANYKTWGQARAALIKTLKEIK